MEKTIYCKIGERRKKIKYNYDSAKSDVESATDKILEVCQNDPLLQKIVENRAIVLQRLLEDKNFLCDFEPEEEIPNESEVHCLLVPFPDENTFIFSGDYTVNQDGILVTPEENTSQSIQEQEKENPSTVRPTKKLKTHHKADVTTTAIPNPAILPKLTPHLEELLRNVGIVESQRHFIYFWATDLLMRTNGIPTKTDYYNYATTIVATYPELRGGNNGCGIVRNELSTNVRNRRANSKRTMQKFGSNKIDSNVKTPTFTVGALQTDIDGTDALKELEKLAKPADTPHVRLLIKTSISPRRKWIKNDAKNIIDVIERYPHLKICSLMIFEFQTFLSLDEDETTSKIRRMLEKLAAYFGDEVDVDNGNPSTCILTKLWERLAANKTKKTSPPLFTVREETSWCRRTISHRGLSTTRGAFAPTLSPILSKDSHDYRDTRNNKDSKQAKNPKDFVAPDSTTVPVARKAKRDERKKREKLNDVIVEYHRGLPRITVPLPSRKEKCIFTLKPITNTIADFIDMLKLEDRGIDRAVITTIDGTRIACGNTIESLLEADFKLVINDVSYDVSPPNQEFFSAESVDQLADVKTVVGQLYQTLNCHEHNSVLEREVVAQLEQVMLELEPLELKRQELEASAERRANIQPWLGLVAMAVQFGILARLTWWEYSWDIMEPVTYFVTYGTGMICYIYFILTRQEYMLPDVLNRRYLVVLHKRAKKMGLDLNHYNTLKEQAYELETTLKIIRGPLWKQKNLIEQKRRERLRSSSSSSSSRSPSSSPSPSPSPSPSRKTTAHT